MLTAEDAIRMAEESFKVKHLNTAINHAHSIKRLDPRLQNTADQLIAAYKVHVTASIKISVNEEPNWYEVLGTSYKDSSDDIIKRQYRKLAILVHPDKNKSSAAEDAFKLISQAYDILSDPTTKGFYNIRCGFRTFSFGMKKCPRCSRPCPYQTQHRSSIKCSYCNRIFVFKKASASRWENNDPGPSSWVTVHAAAPNICPVCNRSGSFRHNAIRYACSNCNVQYYVPTEESGQWMPDGVSRCHFRSPFPTYIFRD